MPAERHCGVVGGLLLAVHSKKALVPLMGSQRVLRQRGGTFQLLDPVPARLFRRMSGTVATAEVFYDGNGKKLKPARKQVKPGDIKRVETPQTGKEYSEYIAVGRIKHS